MDCIAYRVAKSWTRLSDFHFLGFQGALVVKNLSANAGDMRDTGSISGSERSLRGGHGNPLQHSCLGSPMDTGAWQAIVHSSQSTGHD